MKERTLHAYHDGELGERAAARVAGKLEGSEEDRAELARLEAVGDWVRETQAQGEGDVPDLWPAIAARLHAVDAEREERAAGGGLGWLRFPRPLAAGVAGFAALALAAVVVLSVLTGRTAEADVIQWLDAQGAPVMVLDAPDESTIIWIMDPVGGEESGRVARVAA